MARLARLHGGSSVPDGETGDVRHTPRLRTRYYAFLSYSHKDSELADWLHRELERFRVPHSLAGKLTANGVVPRRLTPVFRDQQDLSAGPDLAEEIKAALAGSQFLIVLCSPSSALSRWTNQEIESFKRTRPEGCVLAAIVAGEPFASDIPGREDEECFPPGLRFKYDRRGHRTGKRAEPLAADFRNAGEGRRQAFLKLVAGMLGVGLDDLVQREQTRRQRRLGYLAAASIGGMAITSTLAVTAFQARNEAREQRREAEGLVTFMLGDLKDKLEPIGRLDVLDSVGAKALAFYQKQDTSKLTDEALAQRSKALALLGQVANSRGDLDAALRFYSAAFAGTQEALRRAPDDPQRIFDHAQNVFYLADIAHSRGQWPQAQRGLQEYKRLADRMIEIDPGNPKWQMEGVYADNNLGIILNDEGRYAEAAAIFENARAARQRLAAGDPSNPEYRKALIEGLGWLSAARERQGRLTDALAARQQQIAILEPLLQLDHPDASYQNQAIGAYRGAARIETELGDLEPGMKLFEKALAAASRMLATEPADTETKSMEAWAQFGLARAKLATGAVDEAAALTRAACDATDQLVAKDATVVEWRLELRSNCGELRTRIALAHGDSGEAQRNSDDLLATANSELARTHSEDAKVARANALLMKGMVLRSAGQGAASQAAFRDAAAAWPASAPDRVTYLARRAAIRKAVGDDSGAAELAHRVAAMGFRDPLYIRDIGSVG
ncbi:MAG: TIR domain-containing protein [Sphingomicrobium sp.]